MPGGAGRRYPTGSRRFHGRPSRVAVHGLMQGGSPLAILVPTRCAPGSATTIWVLESIIASRRAAQGLYPVPWRSSSALSVQPYRAAVDARDIWGRSVRMTGLPRHALPQPEKKPSAGRSLAVSSRRCEGDASSTWQTGLGAGIDGEVGDLESGAPQRITDCCGSGGFAHRIAEVN